MAQTPLEGTLVLDLSSGIAGGYCTKLLADGGADVLKLESPDGDPLRRWTLSDVDLSAGEDGPLFQYLAGSKKGIVVDVDDEAQVDAVLSAAARATAVVWSPGNALTAHERLTPERIAACAPHTTVVSITPFGRQGSWATMPSTEFTLQAWCGAMGYRGHPDRPPLSVGAQLGEWITGVVSAAALLASKRGTKRSGCGALVDVSSLEAAAFTMAGQHAVVHYSMTGQPMSPARRGPQIPSLHRTRDGMVAVACVTGQQWMDFCAMIGAVEWMDDPEMLRVERRIGMSDVSDAIEPWFAERTTEEITELATLFRLPVAPVANGENITGFDHFREGSFFVPSPNGGWLQPASPFRFHGDATLRAPEPAPGIGEHGDAPSLSGWSAAEESVVAPGDPGKGALPLAGLRVADFTSFWAGPMCANFFSFMGADVIKVEGARRPDALRYSTVKSLDDEQWWEWSAIWHGSNTNKRGIALDLTGDAGRAVALELIGQCDVVMENMTPRVFDNWGFSYERLAEGNPGLVVLRMPAYGLDGPWRERTAYALTIEAVAGFAWRTGYPDRLPLVPDGPGDPIAGMHAAIGVLLALEHRDRAGKGMLVELPMVSASLAVAAEQVVEYTRFGTLVEREGHASRTAAPQNLYLSADVDEHGAQDTWVAVSVATDEQWRALCGVLDRPDWSVDDTLSSITGRRAAREPIDAALGAWCAARTADDVVATLAAAGVPAARVLLPHQQAELPAMIDRGYFESVSHPVVGDTLHGTFPARFSTEPRRFQRRPPPLLGQHNHEVLCELLGWSEDKYQDVLDQGLIASRPGGG